MRYSEKLNILVKNTIESYSKCEGITLYKKYYDNINYFSDKYRGKSERFFVDNNINKEVFFNGLENYRIIPMLEQLNDNPTNILDNFSKYRIKETDIDKGLESRYNIAPKLGDRMIDDIRYWLFDNSYGHKMLSLKEQNLLMKNYIRFDMSMKTIKNVS